MGCLRTATSAHRLCYLQQQGHSFKLGRCDQILHHSESFFLFWLCQAACRIPQLWIKPMSPALGVQSYSLDCQGSPESTWYWDFWWDAIWNTSVRCLCKKMCNMNTPSLWPYLLIYRNYSNKINKPHVQSVKSWKTFYNWPALFEGERKKKVLEKKRQGRKLLWVDGIDKHLYGLKMETQTECLLVGH